VLVYQKVVNGHSRGTLRRHQRFEVSDVLHLIQDESMHIDFVYYGDNLPGVAFTIDDSSLLGQVPDK
jgi:hypothetical protein